MFMKIRIFILGSLLVPLLLFAAQGRNAQGLPLDLRDAPNSASAELIDAAPGAQDDAQFTVTRVLPVGKASRSHAKAIIGSDDRLEYYEIPKDIQALADSVVALELKVLPAPQGEQAPPLCKSERFSGQEAAAFCSGFLVAPDMVATAGHCVNAGNCSNVKFVFGLAVKQPGVMPGEAPQSEVYACSQVLFSTFTAKSRADDFALVRLDRPVAGHRPLPLDQEGGIAAEGTPIFTIGHFLGFPVKIAGNAFVRLSDSIAKYSDLRWFTSSLDSFPGNSGGPVFNARTRLVEGITVRAGGRTSPDFDVTPEGCRVAHVYDENEEWGPEITNIAVTLPYFHKFTRTPR